MAAAELCRRTAPTVPSASSTAASWTSALLRRGLQEPIAYRGKEPDAEPGDAECEANQRRREMSDDELFEDLACLGQLQRIEGSEHPVKHSTGIRYRFDPEKCHKAPGFVDVCQ